MDSTVVVAIVAVVVSLVGLSINLFFSSRNSHRKDIDRETTSVASQAAGQARLEIMLKQVQDTGEDTKRSVRELKEEFSATREDILQLKLRQKDNLERSEKHNRQINDLFDLYRTLEDRFEKGVQYCELKKEGGE